MRNTDSTPSPVNGPQRPSMPMDEHLQRGSQRSIFHWWYAITTIPEPSSDSSPLKLESVRKSYLLSIIVFWLLICFIICLPGCFALPNTIAAITDIAMIIFCIPVLMLNRFQKTEFASIILTFAFEFALTVVIFSPQPLTGSGIQPYELFVVGELLSVTLLFPGSVFIAMFYNIAIISISLIFQELIPIQTPVNQWLPILVFPLGLQVVIALISFLFVNNINKALTRTNQTELITQLKRTLANERTNLEVGIKQLLETHTEVANGNLHARAPIDQDNLLWQAARALNVLLVRFQRSIQTEYEWQRLIHAIGTNTRLLQKVEQNDQEFHLSLTQTELDPLIHMLKGKSIAYIIPSTIPGNNPLSHTHSSFPQTQ